MKIKLRNIAKGLSLTSVLFIFQACYGTQQDMMEPEVNISGVVLSDTTTNPIKQIKVMLLNQESGNQRYEHTNDNGEFSFYTGVSSSYKLSFSDVDSTENGEYLSKDTILSGVNANIHLDISLEKQ